MKILLLHPPNKEVYSKFDRGVLKRPPIGLTYLTRAIKDGGFDLEVLDAEALNLGIKESVEEIIRKDIDVLGITATTPLVSIASEIAKEVKKNNPAILAVIGGPHSSALPFETLKSFAGFDYVVFGEGEITIVELLKAIKQKKNPSGVSGVGFRDNGNIVLNNKRELVKDLDTIGFPLRKLFPNDKYLDPQVFSSIYASVVTSRGCPFRCIFCGSISTWGKTVRFRSPENVLDELELIVKELNIKNIDFSDDTFTLNKERVLKICEGITKRKLNIDFLCSSRADTIDKQRLSALKKAGCKLVTFGFESGDDKILKIIKKGISIDDIKKAAALTKKYGFKIHASYIIGNPGDTNETIKKTIDFALGLKTDSTQFCIATPYPGSELYSMAKDQNKLKTTDFSKYYWYYSVAANMTELSDEQLIEWQRYAYQRLKEVEGHG